MVRGCWNISLVCASLSLLSLLSLLFPPLPSSSLLFPPLPSSSLLFPPLPSSSLLFPPLPSSPSSPSRLTYLTAVTQVPNADWANAVLICRSNVVNVICRLAVVYKLPFWVRRRNVGFPSCSLCVGFCILH